MYAKSTLLILVVYFFDLYLALPISNMLNPGDRWNFLLLGSMVIGMGAILACVRCRRKKRGFEEFKNDGSKDPVTGQVEAIRTEFPIFQALSTPSSPHFQQLDNESSKGSRNSVGPIQVENLDEIIKLHDSCYETSPSDEERYLKKEFPVADETIVLTFNEGTFIGRAVEQADDMDDQDVVSADCDFQSSVEQALYELDIAIGSTDMDQDDSDEETEGDSAIKTASDDEEYLDNVLRKLFTDNMLSSLPPDEQYIIGEQSWPDEHQAASAGVSSPEECNTTVSIKSSSIDGVTETELQGIEDGENFFNNLPEICQSTPCMPTKRQIVLEKPTQVKLFCDETFEADNIEGTFVVAQQTSGEGQDSKGKNSTITPVNTPIERTFTYTGEDQHQKETITDATFNKELDRLEETAIGDLSGGWFLHGPGAAADETFDFEHLPPPPPPIDNCYDYFTGDSDEDDFENPKVTPDFDALRKQLVDLLPHAQGAPALDDEGAVGGCESGMPASVLEAMLNNIDPSPTVVTEPAYVKRALSPIMEESEEEDTTVKTSFLNETKNSTSTGCNETISEAVMGVTRTLMASNDTLFNFEDTLGDRDDLTPTPMRSGIYPITLSPVGQKPHDDCMFLLEDKTNRPTTLATLTLDAVAAAVRADSYTVALDVLSPELQKTFSEDIISVEHVSGSDASGTVDPDGTYTTNTIEMETCISLNKDEDDGELHECDQIEDLEKDERDASLLKSTSSESIVNDTTVILSNHIEDNVAPTKDGEKCKNSEDFVKMDEEIDYLSWNRVSSSCFDASAFNETTSGTPIGHMDFKRSSDSSSSVMTNGDHNNVTFDISENCAKGDGHISGEEDPWIVDGGMSESGTSGDEGEEVDGQSVNTSDDSSEEFLYVASNRLESAVLEGGPNIWDSHTDVVPIGFKDEKRFEVLHEEHEEEEDVNDKGEWEAAQGSEFVPSSWNCRAKPARSAMKSPDKSSSDEDSNENLHKRRPRSVVFIKQQCPVYEYPGELIPISPSLSEPTFSVNFRNPATLTISSDVGEADGFFISSSTRPFNQCNTWPTENDFSWSQHMQDSDSCPQRGDIENTVVYSEIPVEWPRQVVISEDESGSESNAVTRPDIGVGNSADCFIRDHISLGELCHTKSSLQLPLTSPTIPQTVFNAVPVQPIDYNVVVPKPFFDYKQPLPTPSCTGSMDSLSSSSCSEQLVANGYKLTSLSNGGDLSKGSKCPSAPSVRVQLTVNDGERESETNVELDNERIQKRISDSTDEDSGIENISRRIN